MRIPWPDPRCILCRQTAPLTDEHVIPTCLGGRLVVPFLCKPCNNSLGHRIDALATKDPLVREAVLRLGEAGEPFKAKVLDGMTWTAETSGGKRRLKVTRKHGIDMPSYCDEDGALNLPTIDSGPTIARRLRRAGATPQEIDAALAAFAVAPNDEVVQLGRGYSAIKNKTKAISPVFDGGPLDDLVALKIAYEFLALHLEMLVFEPCFDGIREALATGKVEAAAPGFTVSRLVANRQHPIHGIALEEAPPADNGHAIVHIRLFGRPTWRVAFPWLRFGGTRVIVTQDLITGKVHLGRAA